jgi:hypothetical protein
VGERTAEPIKWKFHQEGRKRLQAADIAQILKQSLRSCTKVNRRKAEFCTCHDMHIHLPSKGSSAIYFFPQADVKYRLWLNCRPKHTEEMLLPTNNLHSKRLYLLVACLVTISLKIIGQKTTNLQCISPESVKILRLHTVHAFFYKLQNENVPVVHLPECISENFD